MMSINYNTVSGSAPALKGFVISAIKMLQGFPVSFG